MNQSQTPESFKCPLCGTELKIAPGESSFQKCKACDGQIIVPTKPPIQTPVSDFQISSDSSETQKLDEIKHLAQNENLIAAIRIYRESFGVNLKQAKTAVENIVDGKSPNLHSFDNGKDNFSTLKGTTDQTLKIAEIQKELQAGRKLSAIKIYREIYKCDLKTAKDAVEAIKRRDTREIAETTINVSGFTEKREHEDNKFTFGKFIFWLVILAALVAVFLYVFIVLNR